MPTYEYTCTTCNLTYDVFQSMKDATLTECPKCGQKTVKRLVGRGAGIIFKGSGFYETDYKKSPSKKEGGETSSGGGGAAPATAPTAAPAPASSPNSSPTPPTKPNPSP